MKKAFTLVRDKHGIPNIDAKDMEGIYQGIGYAHAKDRGLQTLFMRILGQGRISEFLDSSLSSLEIDIFFRRMNWRGNMDKEVAALHPDVRVLVETYCDGINLAFRERYPWELRLLGYEPEPWRIEDSILLSRITGYIALSQAQGEIERLFIEMVQAGVEKEKLFELFPLDDGDIDFDLIKKIQLGRRIVKPESLWEIGAPRLTASNSWVVSGEMSASGKPLLSNDIHLEVNRLPSVWYELVLTSGDNHAVAATMPGLPGILAGRTKHLAWGVTYSYMDAEDSWIEHCENGKFFREDEGWVPFSKREEVIYRKKKDPYAAVFYENDHGVLDGVPEGEKYLLSTKWASAFSGGVSLNAIAGMWNAKNVEEGMDLLGRIETTWNWVLADTEGNIGYQMSGLMPKRKTGWNGFYPVPGWKKENDWKGIVPHSELPRNLNPPEGYFVTANNNLNEYGKAKPINICMGDYRARRISSLLKDRKNLTLEDMKSIQFDLYSIEAEEYMNILKPLLPQTPQGDILKNWDYRYDLNSQGAFLFEKVYGALHAEVFGAFGWGAKAEEFIARNTGTYYNFYKNFNDSILSAQSAWLSGNDRDTVYRKVLENSLRIKPKPWKSERKIFFRHILFGKKLPRFLGFDRGPFYLRGGRATIEQGQIFNSDGRTTSFAPSWRFVTSMADANSYTSLPGGPSDRRFSKWYGNEIRKWYKGSFKLVK